MVNPRGIGAEKAVGVTIFPEDDPTKYNGYATKDSSVMVEIAKEVVDISGVCVENTKDGSNRQHVKFLGGQKEKPAADTPAMAGFELTFNEGGKYIVWVRYVATNEASASVWLDYGAAEYRTHERGYMKIKFDECSKDETDYLWANVGTVKKKAGETSKIRLRTLEEGVVIDKIVITKALAWKPEGEGVLPTAEEAKKLGKMPDDLYPVPPIAPPPGHPRVFLRPSDIEQVKKNIQHPEMAELVAVFNELKDTEFDGHLPDDDPNDDAQLLEVIAAKAADYLLFGNEKNGYNAISAIKNYALDLNVQSAGDNCRQKGHTIKLIGQVYDWCYPLLSDDDKYELMYCAQMISIDMEVGFPPDLQSIMCGHGAELQVYRDWLIMAIAAYDEYPDAFNMVCGKVLSPDSVDYRNWWNQSGTHSQGSCYPIAIRYKSELYAHLILKNMCSYELFDEENLVKVAYEWIYRRRPDGMLMIDGDDNQPNLVEKGTYQDLARDCMFLAAIISKDPILKKEFFAENGFEPVYQREFVQPIDMLVLNDPSIDTNISYETLPYTRYYGSPAGEMVARTGWKNGMSSDDVIATMSISEYAGMNHAHYDCGHFMIYYKGILANDSGWYERYRSDHHRGYVTQTAAHNTLLIGTEYNKWGNQHQGVDGPIKTPIESTQGKNFVLYEDHSEFAWARYQANKQNHMADIIGHEFGPDAHSPEYSYIAGDLTKAYTSDYDDGINEALRHMIFLPTGNKKNPAAFVVFDKIDTKVGGNKKAFLLHAEEEIDVNGNVTTIKRTEGEYNGKLVNQTLLPVMDELDIEIIGGVEFDENGKVVPGTDRRFWNKGKNWPFIQDDPNIKQTADTITRVVHPENSLEAGWGRVEISPKNTGKVDYLLNVMYVGSADDNSPVEKATLIETDSFAGAKIFDRVVMFSKQKERTKANVTFTVPGDETTVKVNVAGLMAGTWSVSVNGNKIASNSVTEDGGMLYITAPSGNYELVYEG